MAGAMKAKPINYDKFANVDEYEEERKQYFKQQAADVRELERDRKLRENAQGSKITNASPNCGRTAICTVKCDGVTLKLTLKQKLLDRPFITALIAPFLGAFNKKRPDAEPLTMESLAGIVVDGVPMTDVSASIEKRARDVMIDQTGGIHGDNVFISTWHDPFKPAEGAMWRTEHEVTLLLAASGVPALADNSVAAAEDPVEEEDEMPPLEENA